MLIGQSCHENDQTGGQNGPQGVGETVLHQQGRAHRLKNEKRRCAKRGIGHTPRRPFAKALGGVAQRVVFHGFARHPAVVVAAHQRDALHRFGGGRSFRDNGGGVGAHNWRGCSFRATRRNRTAQVLHNEAMQRIRLMAASWPHGLIYKGIE
jgi:hypothetical protein